MARVRLTAARVRGFKCPADKPQAFLWDDDQPGLALRSTPAGRPAYVFQGRYQGSTVRVTIGSPDAWSIADAQAKARALQREIDEGRDPRGVKAEALAASRQKAALEESHTVTVQLAWDAYLTDRSPHWKARTLADHHKMTVRAGTPHARLKDKVREAGPLTELMSLRLVDLTPEAVQEWAKHEAKHRPARVRLALRLLKAFVRWAAEEPVYKGLADPTAASSKKAREAAGNPRLKNDCLQREQLAAWFQHVRAIPNPVIAAYLQCLLLTGARREELAGLRWEDVNLQWKGMSLAEKVGHDPREVPVTPFVESLITALPRRNEWVFPSLRQLSGDEKNAERRARYHAAKGQKPPPLTVVENSASGRISDPSIAHRRACAAAGLEGLTLHGLRRSFASLCEWLDIPGGISAQIQGHRPQGVREQNYIRRPLDLLRLHHTRIEAWILEQASVPVPAPLAAKTLKAVSNR
jgi:integrase